jgi:uncharacterized repeat protein (TIGR03803 family)
MKKLLLSLIIFSLFTICKAQITLYGMTTIGGYHNLGTIFRTTTSGNLTTVVKFDSTNGKGPMSSLIQATDGNLYGVTVYGGISDSCVCFRYSLSGGVTVLFDFDSAGFDDPYGSLVQANDSNLYGMTSDGAGAKMYGSIYKSSLSGKLTDLHDFNGTSDGGHPDGALIQATDSNLYGLTGSGSAQGTLFKCSLSGVFTTLVTFNGTNGAQPDGSLIQARDGYLYGMTSTGGAQGDGTIFKCSTSGTITTIHSFNDTAGSFPSGTLVQATDGNLYGLTPYGGDSNSGVVFKCSTSGSYQVLAKFHGLNGSLPFGSLIQASDGNIYGLTTHGGAYKKGTLFTLDGDSIVTLLSFNDSDGGEPYYTSLLEVKGVLGIAEPKPNEMINIYPNPFSNYTIIAVNTDGKHTLEVDDITGRKIKEIEFTGKQYNLPAQGLAQGMYFVRVFDETNTLLGASKIIVQ